MQRTQHNLPLDLSVSRAKVDVTGSLICDSPAHPETSPQAHFRFIDRNIIACIPLILGTLSIATSSSSVYCRCCNEAQGAARINAGGITTSGYSIHVYFVIPR